MIKILDCTLRDGGYYTNWDFSSEVVKTYIETTNKLPVDYLEVGYRNKPTKEYMNFLKVAFFKAALDTIK